MYNGEYETSERKSRRLAREIAAISGASGVSYGANHPVREDKYVGARYELVNYEVTKKPGEDFEHLMRRFKRASRGRDGQAAYEASRHTHYEKPSTVRHRHDQAAAFKESLRAAAATREFG